MRIGQVVNPYLANEKCIINKSMIETPGMYDNARTTANFACAEYSRDRERGRHITEWLSHEMYDQPISVWLALQEGIPDT